MLRAQTHGNRSLSRGALKRQPGFPLPSLLDAQGCGSAGAKIEKLLDPSLAEPLLSMAGPSRGWRAEVSATWGSFRTFPVPPLLQTAPGAVLSESGGGDGASWRAE